MSPKCHRSRANRDVKTLLVVGRLLERLLGYRLRCQHSQEALVNTHYGWELDVAVHRGLRYNGRRDLLPVMAVTGTSIQYDALRRRCLRLRRCWRRLRVFPGHRLSVVAVATTLGAVDTDRTRLITLALYVSINQRTSEARVCIPSNDDFGRSCSQCDFDRSAPNVVSSRVELPV